MSEEYDPEDENDIALLRRLREALQELKNYLARKKKHRIDKRQLDDEAKAREK